MKTLMLALAMVLVAGCGDDNNNLPDMAMEAKPDLSEMPDMVPGCVQDPMNHVELINACTTSESYDKMPFYPMLAQNGVLPPLP